MADITLDDVYHAARQLTPEEQQELIKRLQATRRPDRRSILDEIPVIDVGPWPENLSLRREDMYGDDQR